MRTLVKAITTGIAERVDQIPAGFVHAEAGIFENSSAIEISDHISPPGFTTIAIGLVNNSRIPTRAAADRFDRSDIGAGWIFNQREYTGRYIEFINVVAIR